MVNLNRFHRMQTGWIGIDLGVSSVKLVQVGRRQDRLFVRQAAIVPRSEPWSDPDLAQHQAISSLSEIKTALQSGVSCSGRSTAALLSLNACELNTTQPTAQDEMSAMSTIAQELTSLGVDLRQRVFDYWPGVARTAAAKRGHIGLNVLSLSREWSDRTTRDLSQAGLACETIDGLPMALARAVAAVDPAAASESLAAIDWGHAGATICVLDRGMPRYVRQLRHTMLAEALSGMAHELQLEIDEVHRFLRTASLPGPPDLNEAEREISQVVEELLIGPLEALIEEVQRTFQFLAGISDSLRPQRIYLFGGGALIRGIDAYLSQRLKRPVVIWQLAGNSTVKTVGAAIPTCLLGPAIALSTLKWEERG